MGGRRPQPPFYAIQFFVGMGYWNRLLAWLQETGYDKYGESAYEKLDELRRLAQKKYGDDLDTQYERVGRVLQRHIDSMNDQGGIGFPQIRSGQVADIQGIVPRIRV